MFGLFKKNPYDETIKYLDHFGYETNTWGDATIFGLLYTKEHPIDIACIISILTLALDLREIGDDVLNRSRIISHAAALADMIEDYQKLGLISKQDYKSYIKRIAAISTPALRQRVLIELMLSDPVFRDDRMATSKIDYTDHGLEFLEE